MQKLLTFFFSKNISIYAIFNDQSVNDTLVLKSWAQISMKVTCSLTYVPRHAIRVFVHMRTANCQDQPVHPRSLIRAFVVR